MSRYGRCGREYVITSYSIHYTKLYDKALVDGPQALRMEELDYFLEDVAIARRAYEQRVELVVRRNRQGSSAP